MFLHLSVILFTGGRSLFQHAPRHMTRGVSVQGVSVQGGLCPGGSLSRGGLCLRVSVQGGLCPGGVSVQGGLCPGRSLCPGWSLSRRGLCPEVGLCPEGGLCQGAGGTYPTGMISCLVDLFTKDVLVLISLDSSLIKVPVCFFSTDQRFNRYRYTRCLNSRH